MQNKIELKSHEMMKTDLCKMRGGKSPSRYVSRLLSASRSSGKTIPHKVYVGYKFRLKNNMALLKNKMFNYYVTLRKWKGNL